MRSANFPSTTKIVTAAFLVVVLAALFLGDVTANVHALGRILSMEGILLSDAIGINRGHGGIMNGVVLNTFITVGITLVLLRRADIAFEGAVIAGVFTVAGFSFVGKNIWNVLPIYLGVYLYTRFAKVELKDAAVPLLFSTAIAPLVSYMVFGSGMTHIDLWIRIALAIGAGVAAGFFAPMIATQAAKFHQGFNLYNVGFTMGLVAVVAHGILRKVGIHVRFVGVPVDGFPDYTLPIMATIAVAALASIAWSLRAGTDTIPQFKRILKQTGQAPANFSQLAGPHAVLFNMGVMALICLVLVIPVLVFLDIPFLGVLGASTLTIIGFAAFGKHPLNTLPIIAGTGIGFVLVRIINSPFLLINPTDNPDGAYYSEINIHVFVSAIFFATCLAPLAKEFGWKAGVITGILHMALVMTARSFQGGFNLYNNGWAAGFIAGILLPIFVTVRDRRRAARLGAPAETTATAGTDSGAETLQDVAAPVPGTADDDAPSAVPASRLELSARR